MPITESDFKRGVIIGIVALLFLAAVIIIWPIAMAIAGGFILAYALHPVYRQILKIIPERNLAAFALCLLALLVLFLPLWFIIPFVIRQGFDLFVAIQGLDIMSFIDKLLPSKHLSTQLTSIISSLFSNVTNAFLSSLRDFFLDLPSLLLKLGVALIVFFFALRDGEKFRDYIISISPFPPGLQKSVVSQFTGVTNSVLYGHVITGIAQGLLTGVGLFVFGFPKALLFTLLAILLSIFPIIGAYLVWIPASIFLMATGHLGAGLGLFIYGALFISWIDNFIRSYIVAKSAHLPSSFVMVSMIGGLMVFGVVGLVIGPLIVAYVLMIVNLYKEKKFSSIFREV